MTRRFLHNTPWSSLLDAWSEVHPRLRYTFHVRDDRPPSKQAARSAPPNSAVASAACLEARPGPVTPSTLAVAMRRASSPHERSDMRDGLPQDGPISTQLHSGRGLFLYGTLADGRSTALVDHIGM